MKKKCKSIVIETNKFYNLPNIDQKYKDIMKVIDPIFNDMYEGKEWDYLNENKMKKIYMDLVINKKINWRKSQKCIYPNCNNKSIKRSHTIQKSTSIECISENGHVLSPTLKETPNALSYCMELVGIKEASTFPGFCIEHEKLFQRFEKNGKLKDFEDYKLQIYRTICRELVFNRYELDWLMKSYNAYNEQIQQVFINELEKKYGKKINEIGIKSINFEMKNNLKTLHDSNTKKINDTLMKLEMFHKAFYKDDVYYVSINVPFQIPVAIAGISNTMFKSNNKDTIEDALILLNCLPYENRTELIISTLYKYKDSLMDMVKYISQTQLLFLNFIESFVINGSEHFFIRQSTWNSLSKCKQNRILNDIFYSNWSIRRDYPYSIFDDLREYLIEQGEIEINKGRVNPSLAKHI